MRSLSIPFEDVDLRENPEKAELFKEKGYLTAPIVTFNGETWAGFKFERIKGIALKIKEREKKNDA
jgi:glutaredoxin